MIAAAPRNHKINVGKYADDFIITGTTKELLEMKIKPAVIAFFKDRGLELSEEKSHITHIDEGFDFLGFNVRKNVGKLLIKTAKNAVKRFLDNIRVFIKTNVAIKTSDLIRQLNLKIRGWAIYYRHAVSKRTFNYVDHQIYLAPATWLKRRHPLETASWKHQHYCPCSNIALIMIEYLLTPFSLERLTV